MSGLVVKLVSMLSLASFTQVDPDVEARWRAEYSGAAVELEALLEAFEAEGRFTRRFFVGSILTIPEFKLAASDGRRLNLRGRKSYEPASAGKGKNLEPDVRCLTPEFAFNLRELKPGQYVILNLARRMEGDDTVVEIDFDTTVRRIHTFCGRTLLERMRSSTFVVRSIQGLSEGGRNLVRLEYDWEIDHGSESGTVDLDPARSWAILRSDVTYTTKELPNQGDAQKPHPASQPPSTYRTEVVYPSPSSDTTPSKIVDTVIQGEGRFVQETTLEIRRFATGRPPESLFRLSGYGLPDVPLQPVVAESAFTVSNPWFWGSLGVSLICFGLVWITRRRAAPLGTTL